MPLWAQIGSLLIALGGLGLGIYNSWFAVRRDATRFVVQPNIRRDNEGNFIFTVNVSNRGNSALYIENIWLARGTKGKPTRWQLSVWQNVRWESFKEPIGARDAKSYTIRIDSLKIPIERKMFTVRVYTKDGAIGEAVSDDLKRLGPAIVAAIEEKEKAVQAKR